MVMLFHSEGMLEYSENPYKLILLTDPGISEFYRALLPKTIRWNRPMYASHISVVRKEVPSNLEFWRKRAGQVVSFWYDNVVGNDEKYFWLPCYSLELESIREELGLIFISQLGNPIAPFRWSFHITIANTKCS